MNKSLLLSFFFILHACAALSKAPNLLVITVDDMSCDSVGVYGSKLKGTTPNMDRFARSALRFEHAHVQVGNCFPSRNVMFSGLYPHNNEAEGFYQVKNKYPTLTDLLSASGYYTGIRGKVSHTTPYNPYPTWTRDLTVKEDGGKYHIKDVSSYGESTAWGIREAEDLGKPFYLNINISDPHKPFWNPGDQHEVSRIFSADEVPVPGFLFDHPEVRKELALYYTSVRRADDAVGAILNALRESGKSKDTIVVFLSDHGMPLPFAKTALWHHSTRTPLMIRVPGVTRPGSIDNTHMVSAVDFVPTFLDLLGVPRPDSLFDGISFANAVRGIKQNNKESVFKVYNENSGRRRHPMRAVQTRQYLYIWNPWSDGKDVFKTATTGTATYKTMKSVAASDTSIAKRLNFFNHRVQEELYDVSTDPDCLNNLVGISKHQKTLNNLRATTDSYMRRTKDHAHAAFVQRNNPEVGYAYVAKKQAEATERRNKNKKRNTYKETPGKMGDGDFVIGPDYRIDPDLTDLGNPKGKSYEFSMKLSDSKIFRGDDSTLDLERKPVRKERKIFVYVPSQYKDGDKAPILVMHDGPGGLSLVKNALDNLTISKNPDRKLPPFIVISVQNGGNDSKGSQRGLEYDTMSDRLARFINSEVLPAVLSNPDIRKDFPKIAFTKNPWGRAAMGCSSGGAAALSMGWFRPDLFRRIITYSGTFVDQQDDDAPEEKQFPLGAWEYHDGMELIKNTKKKPLRIFTHVSEFDNGYKRTTGYHNWVKANFQTAEDLKEKGYNYRFVFSKASRHCDRRIFEHTLADTLVWMWRGYRPE